MNKKVGFDFEEMPETELMLLIDVLDKLLEAYLNQNQKVGQQN